MRCSRVSTLRLLPLHVMCLILLPLLGCSAKQKLRHAESASAQLSENIKATLAASNLEQASVGILIKSATKGDLLFGHNSEKLFIPASVIKMFTTATALHNLGADYRFNTRVLADSISYADSSIVGNVYLAGGGDPMLQTADLGRMANQIKTLNINRISGDIICDDSRFDENIFGAGWMWDDASSGSFPPISALSVNRNCVKVVASAGAEPGDSVRIKIEPATDFIDIVNQATTSSAMDSTLPEKFSITRRWRTDENIIEIKGALPPGGQIWKQ